jgi:glycosyltransferase
MKFTDALANRMTSQKISVVTAVYNRAETIGQAMQSVAMQDQVDLEHIVVDGNSTDSTSEVIDSQRTDLVSLVREPDDGIYDALNKGIARSTGDIIGFLHADDLFQNHSSLQSIAAVFDREDVDAVYSDLVYVKQDDVSKVVRYWKSGNYNVRRFRFGWMPPHPTVYVRRSVYEKFGCYRTDVGTNADYECMLRLMVKHQIRVSYLPQISVRMRTGGASGASLCDRLQANRQDKIAWELNGLAAPFGLRLTKPLSKAPQYWASLPTESNEFHFSQSGSELS